MAAAMLMLRATRTRRPARSISISVGLVSSSSIASSRISALSPACSPGLDFVVSTGWRAMIVIRNFLFGGRCRSGFRLGAGLLRAYFLGADLGGEAVDRQPISVDAEAAQGRERGLGGQGTMTEAFAGVDVADVNFHGRNFHRHQSIVQRNRGVG